MFGKIHQKLEALLTGVDHLGDHLTLMRRIGSETSFEIKERLGAIHVRLGSIETWMELVEDTKADEIADRFDALLREHNGKVTNQVLKDLVRQAAKGQ